MLRRTSQQTGWGEKSSGWQRGPSTSSCWQSPSSKQLPVLSVTLCRICKSLRINEPEEGDLLYCSCTQKEEQYRNYICHATFFWMEILMHQKWRDRGQRLMHSEKTGSYPYMCRSVSVSQTRAHRFWELWCPPCTIPPMQSDFIFKILPSELS